MALFQNTFLRICSEYKEHCPDVCGDEAAAHHLIVALADVLECQCIPGDELINTGVAIGGTLNPADQAARWDGASRGMYQWGEDAYSFLPTAIRYANGWVLSATGYREGTRHPEPQILAR